uniref:Leucine-rich repeat-containing protein 45 n=1 Tax=Geotrypetes seraphini TaxID=260995 RepID=A0A6P8SM36_GEOSA|nr:leucine-rich repeat-containing protein 45 [Geotrypetes seraphini]XP_033817438.1 leucine-rich repeat-containing protein 45 [Geotrypetes seraphini]
MELLASSELPLCEESAGGPQELPLKSLGVGGTALDLSGQSLSLDSCAALAKRLERDVRLAELRLSDCMLSEEGVKLLLQGLCANTVIKCLDLKGNNIRAIGAEDLGKLLQQNKSIRRLILEWNNLGMWEDSFSVFCDGLGSNHFLQHLDLRNNQINHQGAGELAMALKCNSSLQGLDLRWNNIGLLGGRALLNCLHNNKTLEKLELSGNNIPSDILKAVDQAIEHNQERQNTLKENQSRTQTLSREINILKEEKTKQFLDLMSNIDKQRNEMYRNSRTSAVRIGQLQEVLEERKSVVNSLRAKLQMAEAELALSKQKVHDLGELLSQAKIEASTMKEELRKEHEESAEQEAKIFRDLTVVKEKNLLYQSKVDELERKCRTQQNQMFELRQELTTTAAELKLRAVQAEERLESEKKRFHQALEDAEVLRHREVKHTSRHMEESERSLQERIQRMEAIRIGLEEELSREKASAAAERLQREEELQKIRNFCRSEEQQRSSHVEEKLRVMTQSRDEAQSHILQHKQAAGELQAKNYQLNLEIERLKRQIEGLHQDLDEREREKVAEVSKVKVELQEQIGHLLAEQTAQEGLKEKIAALERQQKVQLNNHRQAVLDKESEIASLLEKLRLKDTEISRMRDEEAQRASYLQNAVLSYVQSCSLGALSSKK